MLNSLGPSSITNLFPVSAEHVIVVLRVFLYVGDSVSTGENIQTFLAGRLMFYQNANERRAKQIIHLLRHLVSLEYCE